MTKHSSLTRNDVYTRVTAQIADAIEAGADDFNMPWHRSAGGLPKNAATQIPYRGINTLTLWSASRLRGFSSPTWATLRQWNAMNARIRKGEQGSTIVFFKPAVDSDEPDNRLPKAARTRFILRVSNVFNANQVDGWEDAQPTSRPDKTKHLEFIDDFVSSLEAEIRHGGDIAAYNQVQDCIRMPERHRFVGTATSTATEAYYSVLLHEHVHWSGHKSRLNRDLSGRFGDQAYAIEELVAELGAAFLCAELGIAAVPRRDHASYLSTWLTVLNDDKTALFRAAATAADACRYLLVLSGDHGT